MVHHSSCRAVRGPTVDARRGLPAVLVSLFVVGLLVPALAGAAWSAPVNLSPAGQNALDAQVAVDADGDAVFVWRRFDGTNTRIQARARSGAGNLGAVQTLSGAGHAFQPQVAVDADGDAVFVWRHFDGANWRIQVRARSAAGTLSAVQTLSAAGEDALDARVAIDTDGDAVVTWSRFDGANYRAQARARSAAGTLSAVQNLSSGGQNAHNPQVAVDSDGDAVFTWGRFTGTGYLVQARARSAAGALSPVQTLAGASTGTYARVAVDADGDAVFAWLRFDGANWRVQARARSAAGTLSAVQTLSDGGEDAADAQVAVDADGDALFAWRRVDGSSSFYRVQAVARSAAGALSLVQTLSALSQHAYDPQVAVDADGDAAFAWRLGATDDRIQARARSASGVLSASQTVSAAGQDASAPRVAVAADGDAIVAWQRSDGSNDRIQASAGP